LLRSKQTAISVTEVQRVGKYGRPKLDPGKRRDAALINLRLNEEEKVVVEEKARDAGVKVHEWVRLAALERHPPSRPIIPEINHEAWHQTARTLATLKGAIYRYQPGADAALMALLESARDELAALRKLLVGGHQS
jgi:hypothetical protein